MITNQEYQTALGIIIRYVKQCENLITPPKIASTFGQSRIIDLYNKGQISRRLRTVIYRNIERITAKSFEECTLFDVIDYNSDYGYLRKLRNMGPHTFTEYEKLANICNPQ